MAENGAGFPLLRRATANDVTDEETPTGPPRCLGPQNSEQGLEERRSHDPNADSSRSQDPHSDSIRSQDPHADSSRSQDPHADSTILEEQPEEQPTEPEPLPQRRRFFRDNRYQAWEGGLKSRNFEVDLFEGESIAGAPINVKLTKTMSSGARLWRNVLSLGLYECWSRVAHSQVFDVDARLAVTTKGRLLLWIHYAEGNQTTLLQHICEVVRHPGAILFLSLIFLCIVFGTSFYDEDLIIVLSFGIGGFIVIIVASVIEWAINNARLVAHTSVKQFEAKDLCFVRAIYTMRRGICCPPGEVSVVEIQMFFGMYPPEADLLRNKPRHCFDFGSVKPGMPASAMGKKEEATSDDVAQSRFNSGHALFKADSPAVRAISMMLLILTFAMFGNELIDFCVQMEECFMEKHGKGAWFTRMGEVSTCMSLKARSWWTGEESRANGTLSFGLVQTLLAHWIDTFDGALQLILVFWVFGPALLSSWGVGSDRSLATIRFMVDRQRGVATEDQDFEEHHQQMSALLAELFSRPEGDKTCGLAGLGERLAANFPDGPNWSEVEGDCIDASGEPQSSWQQVEEAVRDLLDPLRTKVRVFKRLMFWTPGEEVLAAYPENPRKSWVVWVLIFLTCGLEWLFHHWRFRRTGAIILSNRRLFHISTEFSPKKKSMKVDVFLLDGSLRYVSVKPARRLCCQFARDVLVIATRFGVITAILHKASVHAKQARRLWQGLSLIMETASGLSVAKVENWKTLASVSEYSSSEVPNGSERVSNASARRLRLAAHEGTGSPRPSDLSEVLVRPVSASTAASDATQNDRGLQRQQEIFGPGPWEFWRPAMLEGERILWGPSVFNEDLSLWCRCCSRLPRAVQLPKVVATITTHRLCVLHLRHTEFSESWASCGPCCRRGYVESVSFVPLNWIQGFSITENFQLQQSACQRRLAQCLSPTESSLAIKPLVNIVGFGRTYLHTLVVEQIALPRSLEPRCHFEEEEVLELRRWLGHIALHFSDERHEPLDIFPCGRGWAPS